MLFSAWALSLGNSLATRSIAGFVQGMLACLVQQACPPCASTSSQKVLLIVAGARCQFNTVLCHMHWQ